MSNKKLYVIFEEEIGRVSIKEVTILKDTDKKLHIECEGVCRKILLKSDLNKFVDEYIFSYDKDSLVELWNIQQRATFLYLKKQLQRVKSLIVEDEIA